MLGIGLPIWARPHGLDLSTLASTAWLRGSYSSSPWNGTASAGTSGSHAFSGATAPTAGTAINGFTPAVFNGTSQSLANANPATSTFVSSTQWSTWVMFNAAAAAADGGAGSRYQSPHFWSASDTHASLGVGINASGVFVHQGDTTPAQREAIISCGTGAWHVMFAWWDGSLLHIVVDNGATPATGSCTSQDTSLTAGGMNVGCNYNAGAFFNGSIMDLEIRAVSFSTTDVAQIYASLKARYPAAGLP